MDGQDLGNFPEVIFKKMTPVNIEHLIAELISEHSSQLSPDTVGNIIDILFNKVSSVRPDVSCGYIYFCRMMLGLEVKTSSSELLKFKDLLQTKCHSHLIELLEKTEKLQNHQQHQFSACEGENLLAFTTFINELYNHNALTLETLWACLKSLLAVKEEIPLLCVCRLLKDAGKFLDFGEGKVSVSEIFSNFYQMIREETVSAEVSFMLCHLCDLRENNWNSKGMQLNSFQRIREEIPKGSTFASKLAVDIPESSARPSQEDVAENSQDISQTENPDIETQKLPVEEFSKGNKTQGKSAIAVSRSSPEEKEKSETVMLKYAKGQWSPSNPQGRKKYSRGFLLQIRSHCTTKPKGLPTGLPVLDQCRLDEQNGQFEMTKGTSGKECKNPFKEEDRMGTSSAVSVSQKRTSKPENVENDDTKSIEDRKQSGTPLRTDKPKIIVEDKVGLQKGCPFYKDQKTLPNKEQTRQHHRSDRTCSFPEVNGVVEDKVHFGNKTQNQAVSHQGKRVQNGVFCLSSYLPVSSGGSSDKTRMNSCTTEFPNSFQKPSPVQSKCKSLPPSDAFYEENCAKVTRGKRISKEKVHKEKEGKQENEMVAAEQQQTFSETSTGAEETEISSSEKSEPSLSEEEYETRAESIIEQYLKLNNAEVVKSHMDKLQTPHLQHMFVYLSIRRVVDRHERSSEAIGRLFHELLISGAISEDQFCKGLNDYLTTTEQIAQFTPQYWSNLGEVIGAMVAGGTKSLEFLREVIQTTPGDGKASVFMAEILKACIKFTGSNLYLVLRLWKTSKFSWSLFIADTLSIRSFVEKQDLDFTLSPEERNARKPSKQETQRTESYSVTNQLAGESGREQQTEDDLIPKFQNDLIILLKGNHRQHRAVFDFIENAVGEDVRKTKEFIHALVLAVCLSSMEEGEDGPYTKCQRELLKRRSVLIQRYIRGNKDLEMVVLQVIQALYASLGNPRGVLRTMCEVFCDESVISGETFYSWRDSEDFSEENERATKKFFESLNPV